MSPENVKTLVDDFPNLYGRKYVSRKVYFECDNGWYNIIYALSKVITLHASWNQCSDDEYPIVFQVKEKFGGLRFHYSTEIEAIDGAVDLAQQMSFITCEHCGGIGRSYIRNNWSKTLCAECAFNHNYVLDVQKDDS